MKSTPPQRLLFFASMRACAVLLAAMLPAGARLDSVGDGIPDLWRQLYPGAVMDADSDGDGVSDRLEALAGTDPFNPLSRFIIRSVKRDGEQVVLVWDAVPGKRYIAERFLPEDALWEEQAASHSGPGGLRLMAVPAHESAAIFRLRAEDVDADGDGLTDWEERLLGFSDSSSVSSGQLGRHDFAAAYRLLTGPGTVVLADGRELSRRPLTTAEASRFLAQASFGAEEPLVAELAAQGVGAWLDAQFAGAATSTYNMMQTNSQSWDAFFWRKGWWRSIMLGEDQLRQRMAFALSQIFVINCDTGSRIGDNPGVQGRYYDMLATGGFGSYRELLGKVTYSAQMGFYLSHLLNRKGDPSVNRYPDENFAREIMQLFTIGLWELEPDGSRKVDGSGNFIPTYDNAVIMEMAKVFTGLGFGTNNGSPNQSFFTGGAGNDYLAPMKMFDDQHEPGEKHIFHGISIPAGQTGDKDIADALDALCAHPNIAPFVSRLLIQRFTTSNPSSDYIRRVAAVWENNGGGVRGDLRAVIEAILLDPEARTPGARGDASGKVREPLLRVTALLRAFRARNANNTFPLHSSASAVMQPFGQFPLLSPTVFNFFSPDHQPAGELRDRGLVSPELEIATVTRLLLTDNELRRAIDSDFYTLKLDLAKPLALADDADALLDYLDVLLTGGAMSPSTRVVLRTAVNQQTTAAAKVRTALHLLVDSPDFVVLK